MFTFLQSTFVWHYKVYIYYFYLCVNFWISLSYGRLSVHFVIFFQLVTIIGHCVTRGVGVDIKNKLKSNKLKKKTLKYL